ncbi:MAG: EamA family transporter [Candidatus Omnitrophica bacterium]|nr:EamA family transporter [Candidatus Omnitrophota bacterium]
MLVIFVTLTATFLMQLGYFMWKLAADSLPRIGEVPFLVGLRGFLTHWQWMLGFIATVLGWIFFIKASDLGEISVVQPLMSIGDIFLIFLVVVFLKERLSKREWVGIILTVLGAISLSFEAREVAPVAINWFGAGIFCALSLVVGGISLLIGKKTQQPEVPFGIAVGIGFGLGASLTELMTAYLTLSGRHLESMAMVLNPILPFMMLANVIGLVLLQAAFQRGRAAVIVPIQLSVVNGLVVVSGAFIFSEVITILRICGIATIIAGTTLLQNSNSHGK